MVKRNFYQFSLRVPKKTYLFLRQCSVESGRSISTIIRDLLEKFSNEEGKILSDGENQKLTDSKIQKYLDSFRPKIFENNLLLRKIGRYLNTQIVLETDAQLENHLADDGN